MGTPRRYRMSVPEEDVAVIQWVEAQANLSFSLRSIIKDYISNYGISDATCMFLGTKGGRGPGRPTEAEKFAKEVAQRTLAEKNAKGGTPVDVTVPTESVESSVVQPVEEPKPVVQEQVPVQQPQPEQKQYHNKGMNSLMNK